MGFGRLAIVTCSLAARVCSAQRQKPHFLAGSNRLPRRASIQECFVTRLTITVQPPRLATRAYGKEEEVVEEEEEEEEEEERAENALGS